MTVPAHGMTIDGIDLSKYVETLKAIDSIAAMHRADLSEALEGLGLEVTGPITIEGTWDIDAHWPKPRMATAVFDPSGLRRFPRKLKKAMRKLTIGKPLGRRERQRISIPIRDFRFVD